MRNPIARRTRQGVGTKNKSRDMSPRDLYSVIYRGRSRYWTTSVPFMPEAA